MKIKKKNYILFFLIVFLSKAFAEDTGKKWTHRLTPSLQIGVENNDVIDDGSGKNHFSKVKNISVPVPIFNSLSMYSIPLNLGDSIIFTGSNFSFLFGTNISPITLDLSSGIMFAPFPFLNLVVGVSLGSGWNIADNYGISLYNESKNQYEPVRPFSQFKYDLMAQLNFQFDLSYLIPGNWTQVITTANYQIIYEGFTGAKNCQAWEWMASRDKVNGLQYVSTITLGYGLPWKFNYIGGFATFSGHYNKKDYGKYSDSFKGDFQNITFGIEGRVKINERNSLRIDLLMPSSRTFTQHRTSSKEPDINKKASGRTWMFGGLGIYWDIIF